MFMACCDWEAAIQAEKAERESGQKIENDPQETQSMLGAQNNVNDDITNSLNKSCKRKLKMDFKSKTNNDSIKSKNELLANEDQQIDIDSMMRRNNPLNEGTRRS